MDCFKLTVTIKFKDNIQNELIRENKLKNLEDLRESTMGIDPPSFNLVLEILSELNQDEPYDKWKIEDQTLWPIFDREEFFSKELVLTNFKLDEANKLSNQLTNFANKWKLSLIHSALIAGNWEFLDLKISVPKNEAIVELEFKPINSINFIRSAPFPMLLKHKKKYLFLGFLPSVKSREKLGIDEEKILDIIFIELMTGVSKRVFSTLDKTRLDSRSTSEALVGIKDVLDSKSWQTLFYSRVRNKQEQEFKDYHSIYSKIKQITSESFTNAIDTNNSIPKSFDGYRNFSKKFFHKFCKTNGIKSSLNFVNSFTKNSYNALLKNNPQRLDFKKRNEILVETFKSKINKQFPKLLYARWHTKLNELTQELYEAETKARSDRQTELRQCFRVVRAITEELLSISYSIVEAGEDHQLGTRRSIGELLKLPQVTNYLEDLSIELCNDCDYIAQKCNDYAHDPLKKASTVTAIEVSTRCRMLLDMIEHDLNRKSPLIEDSE